MGSYRQHRSDHGRRGYPNESSTGRPQAHRQRAGNHGRRRDQERRGGGSMKNRQRINADGVFWGLLLIAGGTALLLQRLGVMDVWWTMRSYWPLFIVLVGLSKLVHRRSIWSGLWMIAVRSSLQAVSPHLYRLTYR